MKSAYFDEISALVGHPLTGDQKLALDQLLDFCIEHKGRAAYILRGYAGTGKTTLIGAFIKWLHQKRLGVVLLAPTGRAAKVLQASSGYSAATIHRRIYEVAQSVSGHYMLRLAHNPSHRTLFIVDEASMIGDTSISATGEATRNLLADLIDYVYDEHGCRLIFLGDEAQLPPVGAEKSPALDAKHLKHKYGLSIVESTLKEVVRQDLDSYILRNATALRKQLSEESFKIEVELGQDVRSLDQMELTDQLETAFGGSEKDQSIVICRSNKQAVQFNLQIRNRIMMREQMLEAGDRIMVVKNSYFWSTDSNNKFIANGDILEINRVEFTHSIGAYDFAEVEVSWTDMERPAFYVTVMLNTLTQEQANMGPDEYRTFRETLVNELLDEGGKQEDLFKDQFFNALQIKYAYALTCHKSQGGQWEKVFLYPGYLTADNIDRNYIRWLYTAVTRASENLFLINFPPSLLLMQ